MDITRFDAHEELALRAAYDIERRGELDGREDAPHWSWQEMSAAFLQPDSGEEKRQFLARVDGRPVGYGVAFMPLLDNQEKVWLGVVVDPEHQGRGVGRALLEHLEADVRSAGRTTLLGESKLPFDHVTDHRKRRFAEAAGYTLSNVEICRYLHLPLPEERIEGWAAQAAERHAGYTLRTFAAGEDVPDELVPSLCLLMGQLAVDAPTGEADWEEEVITPERYREMISSLTAAGRRLYETLAIAPDGITVAAQTTLSVPPPGRTDISQWGTFVHREHRGRRLGLAVKAANLRAVQANHPEMRRIMTQNAETNDWMVAINEQIGFEPVEASVEFIKRV